MKNNDLKNSDLKNNGLKDKDPNDNDQTRIPIGIYIHIPFCVKKCDYCDFLSGPAPEETRLAYVRALIREIHMGRDARRRYLVKTVFFGGGTPSILPGQAVVEIITALRECFDFDADEELEVSLEANPGTVTEEKLTLWKEAGINRLSFGLQSADNRELKMLGRIHTREQFLESWERTAKAGYRNRNIDLMSALPGQTVESWERTLRTAAALGPEHLSVYSLIIEEGTPFYQRFAGPKSPDFSLLPDEDTERRMYYLTKVVLKEYGYGRYEISNYARPGFACRHNRGYWDGTQYLGFGVGASSYCIRKFSGHAKKNESDEDRSALEDVSYIRYRNISDPSEYIRCVENGQSPVEEQIVLSMENRMEEFMFLGLRLEKGISFQDFRRRFDCSFDQVYGMVTEKLIRQGLVTETEEGIRLTEYGIDISNYVFEAYLLS